MHRLADKGGKKRKREVLRRSERGSYSLWSMVPSIGPPGSGLVSGSSGLPPRRNMGERPPVTVGQVARQTEDAPPLSAGPSERKGGVEVATVGRIEEEGTPRNDRPPRLTEGFSGEDRRALVWRARGLGHHAVTKGRVLGEEKGGNVTESGRKRCEY